MITDIISLTRQLLVQWISRLLHHWLLCRQHLLLLLLRRPVHRPWHDVRRDVLVTVCGTSLATATTACVAVLAATATSTTLAALVRPTPNHLQRLKVCLVD